MQGGEGSRLDARSSPLRGRSITAGQVARRKAYIVLSGAESLQITHRAHTHTPADINSRTRALFHLHLTKRQLVLHAVLSNLPAGSDRRPKRQRVSHSVSWSR